MMGLGLIKDPGGGGSGYQASFSEPRTQRIFIQARPGLVPRLEDNTAPDVGVGTGAAEGAGARSHL